MSFTSFDFLIFFLIVFSLYWLARSRRLQNTLLLLASYAFYGWVHPWYAALLGLSTLADFLLARRMLSEPRYKRLWFTLSLVVNLGVLGFFKYHDFFSPGLAAALSALGLQPDPLLVNLFLPAGLSFYTLKKLSYMFDVSSGTLAPTRSLADFALYVSFFPQIAAGPIDRPQRLLPQIETTRTWKPDLLYAAWPLLVVGLFKKVVIADSVKVIVDLIFGQREPGGFLLLAGSLGFSLQILADFSAYTDLARGVALLLGFETSENFRRPYLALTPTEFWNRWHITLSTWLRDYIFFPTRRFLMRLRSRPPETLIQSAPPLLTMLVCGIWHGAGWTFVAWGLYYGVLISAYQMLGFGGDWKPRSAAGTVAAWLVMFAFVVFGWAIFRAPSLGWLGQVLFQTPFIVGRTDWIVGLIALSAAFVYSLPLWIKLALDRFSPPAGWPQAAFHAAAAMGVVLFINSSSPDFIYFQF